ncbi:RepB family protein [Aeromonas cavernicola]|uniref:Protein CopB n=1 Tax=Aeromonas cavernicola TaxID=1006623 RepID=A0A2H9U490_9GAMM|nr:RepB family protein [Aeromonas cavernicola]PJG58847.1 hypothetical protein CUC53_10490 [Aeromonas cavernicola]
MSQEVAINEGEVATPDNCAERQRQHVKRKQQNHTRLQCWISHAHIERLQKLCMSLEDSQASVIEQAIDQLYFHEQLSLDKRDERRGGDQ